jgi:hypothetical protein
VVVVDALLDVLTVMDEEFQIKVVDVPAGGATAGMVPFDAGQLVFECCVSILDEFKKSFPACNPVLRCIDKEGIPFNLYEGKQWAKFNNQEFKQISNDFLSVVKLGAGYIRRISGNIC